DFAYGLGAGEHRRFGVIRGPRPSRVARRLLAGDLRGESGLRVEIRLLVAWRFRILGAGEGDGTAPAARLHLRRVEDVAPPGLVARAERLGIDGRQHQAGLTVLAAVIGGDHGLEGAVGAKGLLAPLLGVDAAQHRQTLLAGAAVDGFLSQATSEGRL